MKKLIFIIGIIFSGTALYAEPASYQCLKKVNRFCNQSASGGTIKEFLQCMIDRVEPCDILREQEKELNKKSKSQTPLSLILSKCEYYETCNLHEQSKIAKKNKDAVAELKLCILRAAISAGEARERRKYSDKIIMKFYNTLINTCIEIYNEKTNRCVITPEV